MQQDGQELTPSLALAAVDEGARQFFASRRTRVGPFVDAHFSLRGTLRLHRVALGWDILRAPLNLTLAGLQIVLQLLARALRRWAPKAAAVLGRSILLKTAVSREVEWLVLSELLELPFEQGGRRSETDALSRAILAVPALHRRMEAALAALGQQGQDSAFRARLALAVAEYGVTRAAAAEITTGMLNLGLGGLTLHKLTPGAASMGPALAGTVAQQAAVGAFPLGGWAGGVWYGWFPAAPTAGLIAAATGGLMLLATTFAAFAGIVSDPVQRLLGLHRRRLLRMIDALERQFFDQDAAGFAVHDHYVARLLDVFDIVGAALRLARL